MLRATSKVISSKHMNIVPKNANQKKYIDLLTAENPAIVVASGSAGTGKTLLATHIGVKKLITGEFNKMIITRPTVSVDESIGFLPGSLEKKMEPWTRPIFDVLNMHFSKKKIETMVSEQVIEICPLGFLRGRSFNNCWIICDESQNVTLRQMLLVLTRIGEGSKIIITGDPNQYDRGFIDNGLTDLIERIDYHDVQDDIGLVKFEDADVERHPIIPIILDMYKD
jgi:phosphate starvation-inducible PhoH-like protein